MNASSVSRGTALALLVAASLSLAACNRATGPDSAGASGSSEMQDTQV